MKKSTKGALAAGAAGVLLLGGAGSLAYWTDAETVTGGTIKAGHLKLTPVGTGCQDWELAGTTFDVDGGRIAPGDTLTRHCEYTVSMAGERLAAEVNVSAPSFTGTLTPGLTHSATYEVADGGSVATGTPTTITNGQTIEVDIVVTFPNSTSANNTYNDDATTLTAVLSDFTVTAKQVNPA